MSSLFDSGIRPAIDAHLLALSKEKRDYKEYWSASSAGYCQRKVIFERLGVPHVEKDDDARKQRVFTSGHIFHNWVQDLTKTTGLSIAQEIELQDEDLMVRGHFDDLVLVNDMQPGQIIPFEGKPGGEGERKALAAHQHLILYDYKTVNSRSFLWAKKNGNAMSYYHRMQLGTYMYMLRQPKQNWKTISEQGGYNLNPVLLKDLTEARILKIEKDTLMMMEQQLLWDTQLESDVLSYWNSLNAHWKNKTLPKCACADHDNGFMASEKYNPYYMDGEPCSIELYKQWKAAQ